MRHCKVLTAATEEPGWADDAREVLNFICKHSGIRFIPPVPKEEGV